MIKWANMLDWLKVTDLDEYTTMMNDNITNSVLQPNNDWVQIPIRPTHSMIKGKRLYIFVSPQWKHRYSSVLQYLHATWGRTLWPSWISPISPRHDSYSIHHKNQTILSFVYRIPNFALQIYDLTSRWSQGECFQLYYVWMFHSQRKLN